MLTSGSFKKGHPPTKPKGAINKTTKDIKEAYRMLIENNIPNLTIWLQTIADTDPYKAISILSGLSEFVIPKLARTELKHEGEIDIVQPDLSKLTPDEIKQMAAINRKIRE